MTRITASAAPVSILVTGATGRMGSTVLSKAVQAEEFEHVVGVSRSPDVTEAEGAPVRPASELETVLEDQDIDTLIDFTTPQSSVSYVQTAAERGVACVVGTSGFDEDELKSLREASERAPVLRSANFAPGVHALFTLVEDLAQMLPDYDIEVTETYHNRKRDAPSGTVQSILERIEESRGDVKPVFGRSGNAPRQQEEVGVHARRAGDVTGENQVLFGGNHEVVTITQRTEDRGVFAAGALQAAVALAPEPPGWYEFTDMLG